VGIGGYHLGRQSDAGESIAMIRNALDESINFLDNYWDHNNREKSVWAAPYPKIIAKRHS
jgi:hypothetical protein